MTFLCFFEKDLPVLDGIPDAGYTIDSVGLYWGASYYARRTWAINVGYISARSDRLAVHEDISWEFDRFEDAMSFYDAAEGPLTSASPWYLALSDVGN